MSPRGWFWSITLSACMWAFLVTAAHAAETPGTWTVTSGSDSIGYTLQGGGPSPACETSTSCALAPAAFCGAYMGQLGGFGATSLACELVGDAPITAVVSGVPSGGGSFNYVFACAACAYDEGDEGMDWDNPAQVLQVLVACLGAFAFFVGFGQGRHL